MRLLFHNSIYFPLFEFPQFSAAYSIKWNHTDNPFCGGFDVVCFYVSCPTRMTVCVREVSVGIGERGDEQLEPKNPAGQGKSITFPAIFIPQNPSFLSNADAEVLFVPLPFPSLSGNAYYAYARTLGESRCVAVCSDWAQSNRRILIRININLTTPV